MTTKLHQRPALVKNSVSLLITGTKVLKVEAVDNEGHPITYELGSDAQGKFKINSVTGQITANEVLDREVNGFGRGWRSGKDLCLPILRSPVRPPAWSRIEYLRDLLTR